MAIFILLAITHTCALIGGIWIGIKNAGSSKVEKGIDILNTLKK